MDPPGFEPGSDVSSPIVIDDGDDDLQKALALSLQDYQQPAQDEDKDLQAALALSLHETSPAAAARPKGDDTDDEDAALRAALALSLHEDDDEDQKPAAKSYHDEESLSPLLPLLHPQAVQECYQNAQPFDLVNFHQIMWDSTLTTASDKDRWVGQGMDVRAESTDQATDVKAPPTAAAPAAAAAATATTAAESTTTSTTNGSDEKSRLDQIAASHLPWGLIQHHGGPCGVLAAVQAELLRNLLFGSGSLSVWEALARSTGTILARAAVAGPVESNNTNSAAVSENSNNNNPVVQLVLPRHDRPLTWQDLETPDNLLQYTLSVNLTSSVDRTTGAKRQKTDHEERLALAVAGFFLHSNNDDSTAAPIHYFRRAGGVLLLVMSLVATRGPQLQEDFDDPDSTKLTAQFGHCSQELINLLLTGQAVSNVFDYSLRPSGGEMLCRGISSQPTIGYLSQLESLRYCQVGSFYKTPRYPIWVVGSTSHFTVLWGPRTALRESPSDVLLEDCRRAFKAVEGGEENGFVAKRQLGQVLQQLEHHVKLDPAQVSLLGASLEVNGAEIILWDDFWKATSRLSTGASLESVLGGDDSVPPPLIGLDFVPETDEQMAQRLATTPEWEQDTTNSSVAAVNGGSPVPSEEDTRQAPPEDGVPNSLNLEKFGNTFPLYHYNGLRGGVLTSFRVTRLTPEEAVGASIALNQNHNTGGSADLEDVVRTKWPSCSVNWLGSAPPYID